MVKVKNTRSSMPGTIKAAESSKKTVGRSSASPVVASTSQSKSHKVLQAVSCSGCSAGISEDTKALQCDRCSSPEAWKCASCLHLTNDMYDHLVSNASVPLKWFCDSCESEVMAKNSTNGSCSRTSHHDEKLDHLISVIEKLMNRYEDIEKKLEDKCDSIAAVQLDMRINHLEERLNAQESTLEARILSIEEQLKPSTEAAAGEKTKENAISDEDLIKFAVKEELNRKTEEDRDIESRRKNIIIYRVPEKKMENVADRKASDATFVKDLLDGVFDIKVEEQDIEKMYRLGRWIEDKSRPLLVTFKNGEIKEQIMTNLRNLKQPISKFQGISIAHDLHPKERQEIKQLVEDAKQEHISNANDDNDKVENYRFLVVGKGPRRKVIKMKKKI